MFCFEVICSVKAGEAPWRSLHCIHLFAHERVVRLKIYDFSPDENKKSNIEQKVTARGDLEGMGIDVTLP